MSTPATPESPHGRIIKGHKYDGIKEYDNPMPGWWVWIFIGSVVFAVVYYVGITFMGFVDTYEDDLAASQEELETIRANYAAANPVFQVDEASLETYVGDAAQVTAGGVLYTANCAVCHGQAGEGVIGPNLTDNYWIHDASNVGIYEVITNGVLDKGMTPWGDILSPEERGQLVAFVRSLVGTNPPNPKDPQGELVE